MNIIDSLTWRYATKKFDATKKLSQKQITTLKQAFNLTPTSFGLQPIKMIVINNKELQEKFVKYAFNQRQVADASHLLVICIQKDTTSQDINNYFDLEVKTRGTSKEIVEKFRQQLIDMYQGKTIEERKTSAVYQTYIALGNLMTVCAVEKIDACPMEGFIPSEIDKLLNLSEKNLSSVLLLPVGFRAKDDVMNGLQKVRKPLEETIIEIS